MKTLAEEKKRLVDGNEKTPIKLIERFMKSIDNHEFIYVPGVFEQKKSVLKIDDLYGKKYIAIYSSEKSIKVAEDMIFIDINNIIDALFGDGNLSGVVIDMDDNPVYIERGQINSYSSRKDPRLVEKNWGKGIPKYSANDLKTNEELHDFAMYILDDVLEKQGYVVYERNNFSSWFVNYIVGKESKLYFIAVESGIAPIIPKLSVGKQEKLIIAAKENKAIPLFASVSFGSIDDQRFNKGLALCGDGFYTRFTGLEEVPN